MEFKEKLKKYSETIIKIGANVQKGQNKIKVNKQKTRVNIIIVSINLKYLFITLSN